MIFKKLNVLKCHKQFEHLKLSITMQIIFEHSIKTCLKIIAKGLNS